MLLSDLLERKPALERERAFSMRKGARAPFPASLSPSFLRPRSWSERGFPTEHPLDLRSAALRAKGGV